MTHDNTNTQTFRKTSTYAMVVTALMAAVTCILAPLSVPIGPVPISLTNFAIYLSLYLLDWKKGTLSYLIYLLPGETFWPNRWIFNRIYSNGNHRGYCHRQIHQPWNPDPWNDRWNCNLLRIWNSMVLPPGRIYGRRSTCSLCHSFHSCGSVQNGHCNDYRTDDSQKTWNCSTAINKSEKGTYFQKF